LSRHVTSQHDTLDVSSTSTLFDKLDAAKMHVLDTFDLLNQSSSCQAVLVNKLDKAECMGSTRRACRVDTWRDEPSGIWV